MLLYEGEQRGVDPSSLLVDRGLVAAEVVALLVGGVTRGRETIDPEIENHAKGWALDRMPALDRAILRLAVFELRERHDVPVAVVIDEAVELAKRFSTDDSPRFVNGVLAAVAKVARPTG
jgi:N utilization substance protein B